MFLPNPHRGRTSPSIRTTRKKVILVRAEEAPVGLAFSLEDWRYGQLTGYASTRGPSRRATSCQQLANGSASRCRASCACTERGERHRHGRRGHRGAVRRRVRLGDTFTNESIAHDDVDARARGRDLAGHRPKDKTNTANSRRPSTAHQGRPTFRVKRRGVGPDDHQRHGRASPQIYIERMKREYACEVTSASRRSPTARP
jgi:hypothetical protein